MENIEKIIQESKFSLVEIMDKVGNKKFNLNNVIKSIITLGIEQIEKEINEDKENYPEDVKVLDLLEPSRDMQYYLSGMGSCIFIRWYKDVYKNRKYIKIFELLTGFEVNC